MMLPDHKIRSFIESGHVGLDPYDPGLVQPTSIDVRLHPEVLFMHEDGQRHADLTQQEVRIRQGDFVLASTVETVHLPADVAARFEGKSSLGRRGLFTHVTAGFCDPGFHGQVTLELVNASPRPFTLTAGMRIGQLCFFRTDGPCERPYGTPGLGSHYQHQTGPTRAWNDGGDID